MTLRRTLKFAAYGTCTVVLLPVLALDWLERHWWRRDALFHIFSQMLAVMPGLPGVYLRATYYRFALTSSSWEIHVGFGSIFSHRDATVADRASFGSYCVIGHADIGPDVRIGSRVSIPSGKRQHFDASGRLAAVNRFERVRIGRNTWIGEGAILLADVGENVVVSAGSVVVSEAAPGTIVGGNPARMLKQVEVATEDQ